MTDKNEIQVAEGPSGKLHETPMAVQLGETFGILPTQVINVLRNTIIKVPKGQPSATPAELVVVMSLMKKYELDPMLKQIHAWRDNRGDLAVMMGYDGWVDLARRQPTYLKVSYKMAEDIPSPDGKGRSCPEFVITTVHDERRGEMEMPPVYLEEWYVPQRGQYKEPWQKITRHKLHVVAFRLAIREAYGIGGLDVRDPEDFAYEEAALGEKTNETAARLAESMAVVVEKPQQLVDEIEEVEPEQEVVEGTLWEENEEDGTPCGAHGCGAVGSLICRECGAYYCSLHMGPNLQCMVCGGGK